MIEPTMTTGALGSGKATKEPSKTSSESKVQDRILMDKLEETDKRILALVAGQVSL